MVLTAIMICVAMALMAFIIIRKSDKKEKKEEENLTFTKRVSPNNPLLQKFSNEKYKDLYVYRYREFLLLMLETMKADANGKELDYKEFNYPISSWIHKHSIDPIMHTSGWFRWIDKFERDKQIFSLNIPAVQVRNMADEKVRAFVKKLEEGDQLLKIEEIDKLSESIFIKASVDNYCFMQFPELAK